jgi:hypothetical protein
MDFPDVVAARAGAAARHVAARSPGTWRRSCSTPATGAPPSRRPPADYFARGGRRAEPATESPLPAWRTAPTEGARHRGFAADRGGTRV